MHMHHIEPSVADIPLPPLPCACTALRKASRAVTRFYDEVMDGAAVSPTQFAVLRTIARHDVVALPDLAQALAMDRTTLYRTLKPLERAGWIATAEATGRSRQARLTVEGEAVMAGAAGAWEAAQRRFVGTFGAERWAGMAQSLSDIVALAQGGAV